LKLAVKPGQSGKVGEITQKHSRCYQSAL
jgi:hypothetical protein